MAAADLENRTVILETKVGYIEDRLSTQVEKLDQLCDGVFAVKQHIAKQNGALPRIEANTALAATRINQLEDMILEHTQADSRVAIANAKELATLKVEQKGLTNRQKMIWGGVSAAAGAAITVGFKYLIPFIIALF